jgi:hypothetical protein
LISFIRGGDSKEFVAINLCQKPLAPNKSCTIEVTFIAGPDFDPQTATLKIMDNAAGSPQMVSLTAQTIDPKVQLSATSLSFGTQKENTSSTAKPLTITNTGKTPLVIDSVASAGTDPLDFIVANHCPSSLGVGDNCIVDVTFKPKATGTRSAQVMIKDNAKNSPQSVPLSGKGD